MPRVQRLFQLLQCLRRYRYPVTAAQLAEELGVSVRTIYRDICALQAQGAAIDGAAGLGYVLQPGFMLPPLMFSTDEIEALVLGVRWVAERADQQLAQAARAALAKVAAVLPADVRHALDTHALLIAPSHAVPVVDAVLVALRRAIRHSNSISKLHYSRMADAPPRCTSCTISSASPPPLDALLN